MDFKKRQNKLRGVDWPTRSLRRIGGERVDTAYLYTYILIDIYIDTS